MVDENRIAFLGSVLSVLCLFAAGSAVATTIPVGWWPLNEGSGNVAHDISGNGNDATIYNVDSGGIAYCVCDPTSAVWFDDPDRGTVVSFGGDNATGAYIDAGLIILPLTLEQDFTWAFWAKQVGDGTGINETMLGNRHGASDDLNFSKFTPTHFEFYDNGDTSGFIDYEDIPSCVWLHHTVVKDGDTFTYYRHDADGVLIETGSSTTTAELVALPFYMGGDAAGERWYGWLSDVRIYDQALTIDEVRTTVPEPTTIALLGIGGMALLRRRRA
jgi:hypothetical protein